MLRRFALQYGSVFGKWALGVALLIGTRADDARKIEGTAPAFGKAVRDSVFLQEVGWQYPTAFPLTSVSVWENKVFVGGKEGLLEVGAGKLNPVAAVKGEIRKLTTVDGSFWAIGSNVIHRLMGGAWTDLAVAGVVDVAKFGSNVVIATASDVLSFAGDHVVPLAKSSPPIPIEQIAVFNDSLYLEGAGRLTFFDGASFGGVDVFGSHADLGWDWGSLPSSSVRAMMAQGPSLYLATDHGVAALRGMALSSVRGTDGLPYEDTLCLTEGFSNDLWIGTSRGAIRKVGNEFQYFSGRRWLPGERVNSIAVSSNKVWFATDGGLAEISYHPMTLEAKAAYYEQHLLEWGQKRLGLVHKLEWDERLGEYVREAGDNDGGYSSDYLSAQSYRYAVTGDPEARREAVNTFRALRWLERMTGIPGFPARSVWVKGEKGHKSAQGSGSYPAEWHDVTVAPGTPFEWKGDTSSDELCAHFYAVNLFLDLAAEGEEVEQGRAHLERIATHLRDHKWQLIDVDGKPTRWGRWDPDYFATEEGRFDQGLQSLEILSFMKTAGDVSGEQKFRAAYSQLVEMGYPQKTLRQRAVFPPENVANFEDQLAFWSYWNLMRREKDPVLKSVYRRSFERTWEVLRSEQQPWFNFIYGALTGNDCETEQSVRHLREWPLDLVIYSYQNSQRADLRPAAGYKVLKAADRYFSPREREPMRWDAWTMQADGGSGGRDVVEPSGWLLAYWMGRFHGFISAPEARLRPEINLHVQRGGRKGAEPYRGPARPELP